MSVSVIPIYALRKKCPYSELFWFAFYRIQTEYGEIPSIYRYSVRMQKNADQSNSKYKHFLRSDEKSYSSPKINWKLEKVPRLK